jgi:hypothetical protein
MNAKSSFYTAALIVGVAALAAPNSAAAESCDRACLTDTLNRYLDAVLKHDPSAAPLAADFRYTENADVVRPGEGIWRTASGLGKVQRRYVDPVNGQAVYFGHLEENGVLEVASLRIRVVDRKITEGELVVGRKSDITFDAEGLSAAPPPDGPVSSSARSSRKEMVTAANSYFDGIEHHDSSRVFSYPGCVRIENGVKVTGRPIPNAAPGKPATTDCSNNLEVFQSTISQVAHRRFPVVDEEAGVVLGMGVFNRPPGAKRSDGSIYPRNLLTEIFFVENGRIRAIYAAMHYMTPDNPNAPGWE